MMIRRRDQSRSPRPQRVADLDDQQPPVMPRTFRRVNSNNLLNSTTTTTTSTSASTSLNQRITPTPSPPKQPRYLSTEEILDLCMRLVEGERVHDSDLVEDVRPKLTINMGTSHIAHVPDAVIDIIKDEVARLSLSHNSIDRIPPRISECVHLRYINIRANKFTQFPQEVFSLPYLEILDLSRNRITEIPERISELTSLRVLSIMQNMITDLPDELSGMTQLQILKLTGNPLKPALKKIMERKGEKNATPAELADREPSLTFEIKKFLKGRQSATNASNADNGNISESTTAELPRIAKRGNRFPVVPSRQGSASSHDGRQISISTRPPPLPTRSHYRLASGNNTIHHGASSLTVHNSHENDQNGVGERNRSKSEGRIDSNASPEKQQRRMPFARKNTVLGTLDEMRPYRSSHLRLHSGSDGAGVESGSSSPASLSRADGCRHNITRGVPSAIHRTKGATHTHPVIEGSKSLLYSLIQIYPHLSSLVGVLSDEENRRSRLEILLYNAASHLEQLDDTLGRIESSDWPYGDLSNVVIDTVKRESETCVMSFMHIGNQLQLNTSRAVSLCDPRYIRSLLLVIYGSLTELRNAHKAFESADFGPYSASADPQQSRSDTFLHKDTGRQPGKRGEETASPSPLAPSSTTASSLKGANQPAARRMRSETTIQHIQKPSPARARSRHPPVPILPSSTLTPALNDRSRSSSRSHVVVNTSGPSSLLNTPRSGESFSQAPASQATSPLPVNPLTGLDDSEEERSFEKIFIQLTTAYDTTLQAVPVIQRLFAHQLNMAEEARAPPELRALWNKLIFRCRQCVEVAEQLRERLTNTRIREPAGDLRNQREFWQLCKSFLHAFIELVSDMREAKNMRLFSPDVAAILRPVQRASREAGRLIESSPWSYMAELNASTASTPNHSVSQAGGSVRPPHPAVLTAAAPRQHAGSASNAHSPSNMLSTNATPLSKIASRPPTPLSSGFGVIPPSSRPPIPTPPQTTAHFFDRDRPLPPDPPTQRTDGQQPVIAPSIAAFSLMRR